MMSFPATKYRLLNNLFIILGAAAKPSTSLIKPRTDLPTHYPRMSALPETESNILESIAATKHNPTAAAAVATKKNMPPIPRISPKMRLISPNTSNLDSAMAQ
ncbi:hypothetical protein M758_4G223300 [Ceratodon purpureus]|nr:hypothetical protein M758_4G223300 [Ceratodon purpureus]